MTHHNIDNDEAKASKEQQEAKEGFKDMTDVNQGAAEVLKTPDTKATVVVSIPEKARKKVGRGAKGKGKGAASAGGPSTKGAAELSRIKDQIVCSFCGTNLRFGGTPTVVPVKGKKIPKDAKGQYRFKSPGADSEGAMVGVFCETCTNLASQRESGTLDVKTVVGIGQDGQPRNIAVKDL